MRKALAIIFCFSLILFGLAHSIQATEPLKVGVYDNRPLVFIGSNGEAQGFLIEILEYIGSKEGWSIEYVPGSWTECLERLTRGEIDLLVGTEYSRERNKVYDFTYESIFSDWGVVYNKQNTKISQIVNLDNKKIAVVHDDIHYLNLRRLAEQFRLHCRFVEAYEYDAVLELIARGRVDAGVVNRLYGLEFDKYYDIGRSQIIFSPTEVHFAVPKKQHQGLIRTIDNYLRRLKSDKNSIYYRSLDKWTPTDEKQALPRWFRGILAGAGGLLLLLFSGGLILRSQVKAKTAELFSINQELRAEIAERKRVERRLRLTKFSVDHAADAVFWIASDAKFVYVNEAACSSLGYTAAELLSMSVHDIDPNFPAVAWPEHWKKAKERKSYIIESQHRTKDGRIFPVEITVNFLEFEGGEFHCAFARDISERRDAEKERERMQVQLRQAQKMEAVGTLAGGIAHDFNNLLQAVQGYAQLLLLKNDETESGNRELQQIVRAAKRGGDLTQQLLTFSRKIESELQPIDLNHEVESVRSLLERTIPKMIKIECRLQKNLKIVNGDPGQVEQILMNLAVNAKDAMPEGGELIIETSNASLDEDFCKLHPAESPGPHIQLTVSDTGHGMDKQTLEHIFEPFYTTKETGKGTGLGLATVYGIVKNHQGHIVCSSEPGVGTTFKIYLPAVESTQETLRTEKQVTIPQGGSETILLVDDDQPIRMLATEILENFGYTVVAAADGESGLDLYLQEGEKIDLVILDLIMPGMGGKRCLVELLKIDPQAKVAIASGYSPDGPTEEILKNGAKGFISKPYDMRQMLRVVREALDQD